MTAADYRDRFVELNGGLVVPVDAYRLALDLEHRGVTLTRQGDTLGVRPADRLTDTDRTSLRRWKWHLLALCDYVRQGGHDAHLFETTTDTRPKHA